MCIRDRSWNNLAGIVIVARRVCFSKISFLIRESVLLNAQLIGICLLYTSSICFTNQQRMCIRQIAAIYEINLLLDGPGLTFFRCPQ